MLQKLSLFIFSSLFSMKYIKQIMCHITIKWNYHVKHYLRLALSCSNCRWFKMAGFVRTLLGSEALARCSGAKTMSSDFLSSSSVENMLVRSSDLIVTSSSVLSLKIELLCRWFILRVQQKIFTFPSIIYQ